MNDTFVSYPETSQSYRSGKLYGEKWMKPAALKMLQGGTPVLFDTDHYLIYPLDLTEPYGLELIDYTVFAAMDLLDTEGQLPTDSFNDKSDGNASTTLCETIDGKAKIAYEVKDKSIDGKISSKANCFN